MTTSRSGRVPRAAPTNSDLRPRRRPITAPPMAAPRAAWVTESMMRVLYGSLGPGGIRLCPGGSGCQYPGLYRTVVTMGARQIPGTHQEFLDDFRAGETECTLEQLDPLRMSERVVHVKPGLEATMAFTQVANDLCIVDHRIDLEPIANDAGVIQQPRAVTIIESGYAIHIEVTECATERRTLLQHGQPGQACLVDFQHQAFEQHRLVMNGKAILVVVIRAMKRVAWCGVTVV